MKTCLPNHLCPEESAGQTTGKGGYWIPSQISPFVRQKNPPVDERKRNILLSSFKILIGRIWGI